MLNMGFITKQKTMKKLRLLLMIGVGFIINPAFSQTPVINLNLAQANKNVSPMLYGLMTEEINHAYDGGLYAELIRNRIFKDSKTGQISIRTYMITPYRKFRIYICMVPSLWFCWRMLECSHEKFEHLIKTTS